MWVQVLHIRHTNALIIVYMKRYLHKKLKHHNQNSKNRRYSESIIHIIETYNNYVMSYGSNTHKT